MHILEYKLNFYYYFTQRRPHITFHSCWIIVLFLIRRVRSRVTKEQHYLGVSAVDFNALSAPDVGIVDDFLNLTDVMELNPDLNFQVTFKKDGAKYGLNNSNRQLFSSELAENIPDLNWVVHEDSQYTIIFVDVDFPNGKGDKKNNEGKQFLMWLCNGIIDPKSIESTPVSYLAPAPSAESSNNHRFVFILLKEGSDTPKIPAGLPEAMADDGEIYTNREQFDFKKYIQQNHLQLAAVDYFISPPSQPLEF